MVTSLDVEVFDDRRLAARAATAAVDHERSDFAHEVKAITYHELEVRRTADGFEARVIVDI
jgi:SHS2 domain-containing protein